MHPVGLRTARLLTVSRSLRGGRGVSAQGVCPIACWDIHPAPSVNRITDRCKNITLPQTSSAGSKNTSFVVTPLGLDIKPILQSKICRYDH